MAKQSAKQLQVAATEAFYGEDMVALEVAMTELQQRFPVTAARLRTHFEDLIHEREYLDDVGEIQL
jgi:hypothetical protein